MSRQRVRHRHFRRRCSRRLQSTRACPRLNSKSRHLRHAEEVKRASPVPTVASSHAKEPALGAALALPRPQGPGETPFRAA